MGILTASCFSLFLGLTTHYNMDGNYNNVHPHIQCEKDGVITGMYYNSESELSVYLGKQFNKGGWTIDTALVTGYEDSSIQPMIRFKKKHWYFAPTYETIKYSSHTNIGLIIGFEIGIKNDGR
jgi:hypothetical protein